MPRLAPLLPIPLLLALAAWGSTRTADAAGSALGAALAALAGVVQLEQSPKGAPESSVPGDLEAAMPTAAIAQVLAGKPNGKRGRAVAAKTVERALFVSAATVLKLAETRARPRAVRAASEGIRPAGLRLSGVAALGIGLRDGDVLTRALGAPASSSADVIRAILLARAKGARVLEGEFYRGQERWTIRVEQPYIAEQKPRVVLKNR